MPLRKKYPITQWLLSHHFELNRGDTVAFYCKHEKREIQGIFSGMVAKDRTRDLLIFNGDFYQIVNYFQTICYVIQKRPADRPLTQRPFQHLFK